MQCPICSSELAADAVVCDKCGARRITRRTPGGVLVGWLGMLSGLLWIMMATLLLILPFTERGLGGFPWGWFIAGGILTAALLYYSRSTRHAEWERRE